MTGYGERTAGRRDPRPGGSRTARRLVAIAAGAYVANCLWGTAVAVRVIRTRRLRLVHHGLFVVTATATGIAATTPAWTRSRAALFLLPALVPLAVAPRTDPRSPTGAHWRVAVAAAPAYLGAVLAGGRTSGK